MKDKLGQAHTFKLFFKILSIIIIHKQTSKDYTPKLYTKNKNTQGYKHVTLVVELKYMEHLLCKFFVLHFTQISKYMNFIEINPEGYDSEVIVRLSYWHLVIFGCTIKQRTCKKIVDHILNVAVIPISVRKKTHKRNYICLIFISKSSSVL